MGWGTELDECLCARPGLLSMCIGSTSSLVYVSFGGSMTLTMPSLPFWLVQAISAAGSDLVGVVVSLGGKTKDVGPTMLTDGTTNVISAMKRIAPQAKVRGEIWPDL